MTPFLPPAERALEEFAHGASLAIAAWLLALPILRIVKIIHALIILHALLT